MNIGIIAAMPIELDFLLHNAPLASEQIIAKRTFYQTTLPSHTLFCVASGVGKVNAAIYSQLLITTFKPDILINIGIAGGIATQVSPLDLIIGSHFNHHDVNSQQLESLFPFVSTFKADPSLVTLFSKKLPLAHVGGMVSGERFITEQEERQRIMATFKPLSVDMETSAIAHTCFVTDTPFIALRAISDLADSEATQSYASLEQAACEIAGKALLSVLSYL